MGFTEPDTPPTEPAQMPQAGAGPAPAPYSAGSQRPEPPDYSPMPVTFATPGVIVLGGVEGNKVQESGYAHDVNAGLVSQFYPGAISPIGVHGNADAGGRDDVSGTVAGAVANSEARYLEHESDTHPQGSALGDPLGVPVAPPGNFEGAFYDPPRDYGAH